MNSSPAVPPPSEPSAFARYLTEDHARLAALLAASVADATRFDEESFEQFRAGLLRHIGIEEKILLPAARHRRGGEPLPAARALRIEHAALASLMVPTPDPPLVREIRALLEEHNLREEGEDGVYAVCVALAGIEADALLERARATSPPPLAQHFDGEGVYRTAAEALRAASGLFARREERTRTA